MTKRTQEEEVAIIAQAMLDKKAHNVCAMDLRPIGTALCDRFVICDAPTGTQVSAIADNVEEQFLLQAGEKVRRVQGKENNFWIILDYIHIVVHIFQSEYRHFYRLEDLWADAPTQHFTEPE